MEIDGRGAEDAGTGVGDGHRVLRSVSRGMVQLYKEQFGRGPETVATHYSGPDTLVTLLYNSLTPVERNMRDMGEHQRLRDIRTMFQHATEPRFRAVVEEITGRRVHAFMSGIDVVNDVSCEVFLLEPQGRAG
jgi:uncharacterized protein YbcI